jgi:hypothetical protein
MKPNAEQVKGAVRTILAVVAGYLKGRSKDLGELLDPVLLDAVATLMVMGVLGWSYGAKRKGK